MSSRYLLIRAFIGLCIACFVILLARISLPGEQADRDRVIEAKVDQFVQRADDLEAVTVGNSHGLSFHFASLDVTGMHFWDAAADIEESVRKARYLVRTLPNLKYIFLAVSPGSMNISQRYIARDYTARMVTVRRDLPMSMNLSLFSLEDSIASLTHRLFPVERIQKGLYSLVGYEANKALIDPEKRLACMTMLDTANSEELKDSGMEDGIVNGYRHSLIRPECIAQFATANAADNARRVRRTMEREPNILRRHGELLVELADELQEKNIQLVIAETPLTEQYYNISFLEDIFTEHTQFLNELAQHPAVEFYDFHDAFFDLANQDQNTLFYDHSHLAYPGSVAFSKLLKEAMEGQVTHN